MSGIPERLWNVVQGYWHLAQDRVDESDAQAAAYEELAEALRHTEVRRSALQRAQQTHALPTPPRSPSGARDPLAVSYELLQVKPGVDLPGLEAAYQARLAELPAERYAEGSAERKVIESQRHAVEAAYEKLRDVLNPTETRFEKIEF